MLLYLIFIFAAILVLSLAGLVCFKWSQKKSNFLLGTVISSFTGCILLIFICLGLKGTYEQDYNNLEKTYKYLTLYQPLVEESEDEYLRYSFYNQVNEYNDEYRIFIKGSTDFWTSNLYPKTSLDSIDFYLNGNPSNSINF